SVRLGELAGGEGTRREPDVTGEPVPVAGVVGQAGIAPFGVPPRQPRLLERGQEPLVLLPRPAQRVVRALDEPGGRPEEDQPGDPPRIRGREADPLRPASAPPEQQGPP